jgi:hypothetical protein
MLGQRQFTPPPPLSPYDYCAELHIRVVEQTPRSPVVIRGARRLFEPELRKLHGDNIDEGVSNSIKMFLARTSKFAVFCNYLIFIVL